MPPTKYFANSKTDVRRQDELSSVSRRDRSMLKPRSCLKVVLFYNRRRVKSLTNRVLRKSLTNRVLKEFVF
jgi:hypothetical protein